MASPIPTGREIHQLKEKIKFLKSYEGARAIVRHVASMRSFAEQLGIPFDTLNHNIKPERLWLSDRNEAVIVTKCGFDISWEEWYDQNAESKPNQDSYEVPRKDTCDAFAKRYRALYPPRYPGDSAEDGPPLTFQSDPKNSTIQFTVDGNNYELNLSSLAKVNMEVYEMAISDFQSLLTHQARTHKSLLLYDYDSVPCPLPGGMTAILSKQGVRITLEWMMLPQRSVSLEAEWIRLCRGYLDATRLKYRADHSLLLRSRNRREAIDRMTELVQMTHTYLKALVNDKTNSVKHEFLERKHGAEESIAKAERAAEAFEGDEVTPPLGELAVYLDMTLSNVHKLIMESSERMKARRLVGMK